MRAAAKRLADGHLVHGAADEHGNGQTGEPRAVRPYAQRAEQHEDGAKG
ncbi:hypothetical protein FHS42_006171 [Streptomyces zagrosensis]|uniref:Uncharacterized protein n=1 Tax=Streptomyces zagrosensis TaxID=1042984 RepID=A0A7W9QFK0_9ACTN|nr:hypothetical protein [Streptomyces zagrosensis]